MSSVSSQNNTTTHNPIDIDSKLDTVTDMLSYFFPRGWFTSDLETKVYYIRYRKICNSRSYSKFRWKKLYIPAMVISIVTTVIFSAAIPGRHSSILGPRVHKDEIGPFSVVNIAGTGLLFITFVIPFSVSYSNVGYILWALFGYFCLNTAYQIVICKYLVNLVPLYKWKKVEEDGLQIRDSNQQNQVLEEESHVTEHELRHLTPVNSQEQFQLEN
jgi:hypothetical protein